jgi:hypothetical protein
VVKGDMLRFSYEGVSFEVVEERDWLCTPYGKKEHRTRRKRSLEWWSAEVKTVSAGLTWGLTWEESLKLWNLESDGVMDWRLNTTSFKKGLDD